MAEPPIAAAGARTERPDMINGRDGRLPACWLAMRHAGRGLPEQAMRATPHSAAIADISLAPVRLRQVGLARAPADPGEVSRVAAHPHPVIGGRAGTPTQ